MENLKNMTLPKGTLVHKNGIPMYLTEETIVSLNESNHSLIVSQNLTQLLNENEN